MAPAKSSSGYAYVNQLLGYTLRRIIYNAAQDTRNRDDGVREAQ